MREEDMLKVLVDIEEFIRVITRNKGVIYLFDNFYNRQFVDFARNSKEYNHIRFVIEDGEIPLSGIRMNDIDYIIRIYKEKEGV